MNPDVLLTATEAEEFGIRSRHAIGMWKARGKVKPAGKRGRSPLYRWGDLIKVARDTSQRAA